MKKIFIHSAFLLAVMAVLTSCLKDKGWEDGKYGIKDDNAIKTVTLPQSQETLSLFSLNADPPLEDIDAVLVQLASKEPATEDVKVTLVKDMSLVAAYNNVNFTNYIEMPSNTYQILNPDGLTVVIPKGQHQAWLRVKIIKANFDFTQSYALGFSIASATPGYNIASNYRGMILGITVKNKFDGLWRLNGTLVDIANPALGPYPNAPLAFVTSGPTSVTMYNKTTLVGAWFDQPFHPITNAGAYSVYGGWAPVFTFNSADNLVQVTNYYGQPNPANTRGAVIDPTGINNYAVLSGVKTIRAKYILTQPSTVPTPPNHRVFFNSTFTYVGPR
jgi:hypothetical protein